MSAITQERADTLRRRTGRVGVWLGAIALLPADEERAALAAIESLGYGTAWFGEGPVNREALSRAAMLLAASERMMLPTGIANIWARDAAGAPVRRASAGRSPPPHPSRHPRDAAATDAGRVRDHLDAGADHVAIQPYAESPSEALTCRERLAPMLASI